jgi:NhaP-type Na+/H+ or K+/H+ antiporter
MAVEHLETGVAAMLPAKVALIGVLGVGAQWVAWRLHWPAIVLLSLAGLTVGPLAAAALGHPLIDPGYDFGGLLRPMVALAVAVILFEGGLALQFKDLRDASKGVQRLIYLGAPIGWALGAVAARYAAGLPWDVAALFGGLLVVTGPTVILPLLRQSRLTGRAAALLKWEGIVNDPVGALIAVFAFEAIRFGVEGRGWMDAAAWILGAAAIGGALGVLCGFGMAWAFRRGHIPEFLKAPVILVAVLACYVIANRLADETGLLAVTVFGITLGNARLASIDEMRRFKETIATLLVSGVFVMLTATLTPADILALDWRAAAFVAVMMLLVRPLTVWTATIGAGLDWRERALVGWIAPRGIVAVAVAGFFAGELILLGREEGAALVPLAFAMVFATVIAHGFTIKPLAARLGLTATGVQGVLVVGASPWSLTLAKAIKELEVPVIVADTNWRRLKRARLDGLEIYFGEVLSEAADHRLDLARIGWVVATTSNDAYNALVCVEFAPEVGRHGVFQLPGVDEGAEREESRAIAFTARGRSLLKGGRTFDAVAADLWRGWRFRATKLSEEYPLAKLIEERGEEVDLVFEKRANGAIALLGPNSPPRGGPGAVILSFAPPRDAAPPEPKPAEAAPPEG